uniref:Uncharacterized protein n=1 Tax=Dulem virus 138 TaxID=3145615 RepID=A0AAU8B450_9VIRU
MNFDQNNKYDELSEFQKLCRTIRHLLYIFAAPFIIILFLIVCYILGGISVLL